MNRDLRLYYFDGGILKKVQNKYFGHNTIQSVLDTINERKNSKYFSAFWTNNQFIIVEYYQPYKSKIISIYENGELKII